jgi:hypothetical protein
LISDEDFFKAAAKCWICLNSYEPSICPFFRLKEVPSKKEYMQIASKCPYHKEPRTPEEILKVL